MPADKRLNLIHEYLAKLCRLHREDLSYRLMSQGHAPIGQQELNKLVAAAWPVLATFEHPILDYRLMPYFRLDVSSTLSSSAAYQHWLHASGHAHVSQKAFTGLMTKSGIRRRHTAKGAEFLGIRLKRVPRPVHSDVASAQYDPSETVTPNALP